MQLKPDPLGGSAALRLIGFYIVGIGVVGAAILPVSGNWLLLPLGAIVLKVAREITAQSGWMANTRIGSVVIRCYEFDRMLEFWQAALGYVPREPPSNGWVVLRDPSNEGPNLSLDRAPERRTGRRGWLHLDLYTANRESEVQRLLELGARRYPWNYSPGNDFVVLEDPDGNLFCVW